MSTQPITPAPEVFPDWHDPSTLPQTLPQGWDPTGLRLAAAPVTTGEDEDPKEGPVEV